MYEKYFLLKAPTTILISLLEGPKTKRELFKKTGINYSHIVGLIETFSELGLVEEKKESRGIKIYLTKRGEEIALTLKKIKDFFEKIEGGG
uniref:HTH marR-type domain-containing protein n=1 Tax=Geoglobus ahangari TaxID=113653 RepID=A0A7J3TIM5_9EURY